MNPALALFLLLFLMPNDLDLDPLTNRWVLWNVGQGLWTTEITPSGCRHIDAGGERWPRQALRRHCKGPQSFYLSHGDWDHIGGLSWIRRWAPKSCIHLAHPHGLSRKKKDVLAAFRSCPKHADSSLTQIHHGPAPRTRDANSSSDVWILRKRWLLPGDSPSAQEKIWRHRLSRRSGPRVLVLGHHGSRTSTSRALLESLPQARMAIASSRQRRHGHPHPDVRKRLREARIALVSTEEWGHLIFEL